MKQTVKPDPYADRCCITVRVFHCANRPPLQILTAVHHRCEHAAAGSTTGLRSDSFMMVALAGMERPQPFRGFIR